MRILANENIAGDVVDLLREHGHDVVWIRTDSPGANDNTVITKAHSEQRLLITFDKDFGELVWRRGTKASYGVVLFRLAMPSPETVARKIVNILESSADWFGHFSVADDKQIRMTPLPKSKD